MEKIIILKEQEAREIGCFLSIFLANIKTIKHKGERFDINTSLLKKYKKFLWGE